MSKLLGALMCFLAAAGNAVAGPDAKTYGIYWMTDLQDCNRWGAPMVSPYYVSCTMNGSAGLSICPNMGAGGWSNPYSMNRMIQVKSARVTQILSDRLGQGYFVLGSGFSGGGIDVFVEGSSTGGGSFSDEIPPGMSLFQGTSTPSTPDGSHFDLYAQCYGGARVEAQQRGDPSWQSIPPLKQQFIVRIMYKDYDPLR